MYRKVYLLVLVNILLLFALCSCSPAAAEPTSTATAANTEISIPTVTKTPSPSATPTLDLTVTQQADDFQLMIPKYYEGPDVSTLTGKYHVFKDFETSLVGVLNIDTTPFDVQASNFIMKTHITIVNATGVSSTAGCGIAMDQLSGVILKQTGETFYYQSAILSIQGQNGTATLVPLSIKSAKQHFGHRNNPGEIDAVVVVVDNTLSLFVSDKKVLTEEITPLSDNIYTPGFIVLAGDNYDFGTRCSFTNTDFWEITRNR